jgi:hypothetical protein
MLEGSKFGDPAGALARLHFDEGAVAASLWVVPRAGKAGGERHIAAAATAFDNANDTGHAHGGVRIAMVGNHAGMVDVSVIFQRTPSASPLPQVAPQPSARQNALSLACSLRAPPRFRTRDRDLPVDIA